MKIFTVMTIILLYPIITLTYVYNRITPSAIQVDLDQNSKECYNCQENVIYVNATKNECSSNPDCIALREYKRILALEESEFAEKCIEKGRLMVSDDEFDNFCVFTTCVYFFSKKIMNWENLIREHILKCANLLDD